MLNVTIQNDGKIKIQSECSGLKELKSNVNLLFGVVQSMEIEQKTNKAEKVDDTPVQTTYYLYLDKVENNIKLSTVRVLSQQLNMPLERAKAIIATAVDGRHDILLSQSPDESFINTMKGVLESAGCICRITKG